MMRALRRRVRRLRQELMADRPPQERALIVFEGLALTAGEKVRARIVDMVEQVHRERSERSSSPPAPPPPPPAASPTMPGGSPPGEEERPAYWDIKVTGPLMSPEEIATFWDRVEAEYKRHEAEMAGKAKVPASLDQPPPAAPTAVIPPSGNRPHFYAWMEKARWRPRGEPELYPDPPEKPDPDDPF
jgi:hypothetical protein